MASVLERWFDQLYNHKDRSVIYELGETDCIVHMPDGSKVVGIAVFEGLLNTLSGMLPDMRVTVDEVMVEPNRECCRWTFHGTHSGALDRLDPSGNPFEISGMSLVHLRNGKIHEGWNFWDTREFARQLDAPVDFTL